MAIPSNEIRLSFVRASGPGGQNVNKVSTAVELRFDVRHSPSLSEGVKARLEKLAGKRMTQDGVLVISAQSSRTQESNREEAIARLEELVARASVAPKRRRATKPPAAARERRLESKGRTSEAKRARGGRVSGGEE